MPGHSVTVGEESTKHSSSDITYPTVEEEKYQLSHRLYLLFLYFITLFKLRFYFGRGRGTSGAGCNLKFNIIIPGQSQWNYYLSMNLYILYVINLFQKRYLSIALKIKYCIFLYQK